MGKRGRRKAGKETRQDRKEGRQEKRGSKAGIVLNTAGTILLLAVVILCVPITVPRVLGCQVYNVISGSMEPSIPTGSLVYVKPLEPAEVEEEDVIAFYGASENASIVTHRVVENHKVSGEFITKGDANEAADPMPVDYDNLLGKVIFNVPYLGQILAMVATLQGKIVVGCMIGIAIVLFLIGGRL